MTHGRFNRRDFLRATGCLGCAFAAVAPASASEMLAVLLGDPEAASSTDSLADLVRNAPVARYWASTASTGSTSDCGACHPKGELAADAKPAHREALVRCLLCARNCTLKEGERGMCRARIHVSGQLKTLVYGRPISMHVDPIEKKPCGASSARTGRSRRRGRKTTAWSRSPRKRSSETPTSVAPR